MTHTDCLDYRPNDPAACDGPVEYRESLSGTGVRIQRCDRHQGARLVEQDRIERTYGVNSDAAPSWIDPSYAGERW